MKLLPAMLRDASLFAFSPPAFSPPPEGGSKPACPFAFVALLVSSHFTTSSQHVCFLSAAAARIAASRFAVHRGGRAPPPPDWPLGCAASNQRAAAVKRKPFCPAWPAACALVAPPWWVVSLLACTMVCVRAGNLGGQRPFLRSRQAAVQAGVMRGEGAGGGEEWCGASGVSIGRVGIRAKLT